MGNNPSRPGLDPRISSDRTYRDRPRGYTTRGKKSKYDSNFYEDDGEDYLPQVPYAPAAYPQMTYGPSPYINANGQYLPAQQMLFPQPQMQAGITPVIPGMGMNGAIPTVGNPFPAPAMNMGPAMPEPQILAPPPGQAGSVDPPVIPPFPPSRRGRAATPYMPPGQWDLESSSDEGDELTAEARARLQPPLRPGQYGPFDPVRDNRTRTPQPILQRGGDGGRRHRRAESSPAYTRDSPPFDDPPQPPVIPPGFTGGPPFPHHPGFQPMQDWPTQPEMGMGMGMGGMPMPQPQHQPEPQRVEPELPPYRPRPFEPIQRSHNPLPAPPRDILHSSPYAKLIEDLRKPIDHSALKAKIAAAPAIHTIGAVNIAPHGHHPTQARSGPKDKDKKKKGLFRSLSSRLAGSGARRPVDEPEPDPAAIMSPPYVHVPPQTFAGGHAVAVYPVVQHLPDGSMALVYNHPPLGPDGAPIAGAGAGAAPPPPPPVLSPGSAAGMPGYVPSATPASAALNVGPMPTPVMDHAPPPAAPPRMPTPVRMPTPARTPQPQPTPPPPVVKIRRTGERAELLHFSGPKVHYAHRSYPTGVHLLEALKFLGGARDDLAERVRGCGTAEEAVAVSEGLREYWRRDWEQVKLEMLEEVLYHKFVQHATLRGMLMATGGADLVFEDADVTLGDGGIGQGLNLLGRALMQVRARLREEGLDS